MPLLIDVIFRFMVPNKGK